MWVVLGFKRERERERERERGRERESERERERARGGILVLSEERDEWESRVGAQEYARVPQRCCWSNEDESVPHCYKGVIQHWLLMLIKKTTCIPEEKIELERYLERDRWKKERTREREREREREGENNDTSVSNYIVLVVDMPWNLFDSLFFLCFQFNLSIPASN